MHLYLVRITNSTKPHIEARYKTGYTKWGPNNIIKGRFRYNDDFKGLDVELLAVKNIQHASAYKARAMCKAMEQCKKTQEQLEIMNNQIDRMEGMIDALDNKYG